jgi:uncharacterized protein YkwD
LTAAAFVWAAIAGSAAAATTPGAQSAASCRGAELLPTAGNASAIEAATLCLVDRDRAAQHLGPLRANGDLRAVATRKVRSMVRWNYFADIGPGGQTPLVAATRYRANASSVSIAQNIAWGTDTQATPASIVAGWMASPPHRRIILTGSYRDAGVAAIPVVPWRFGHGAYGATYAIEFGKRR